MSERCITCNQQFTFDPPAKVLDSIAPNIGEKIFSFSPPKQCWSCRRLQRVAFKNERKLYRRNCSKSGEPIVSTYPPNFAAPVYKTGIDFNEADDLPQGLNNLLDNSVLDEYLRLKNAVPRGSVVLTGCDNCDYNNSLTNSKNCYLCFGSTEVEDSSYCTSVFKVKDCYDCFKSTGLELSYDCFWMRDCYECRGCNSCSTSRDLLFCDQCSGCNHCFGCFKLNQKSFCIFNEQYTEIEYFKKLGAFKLDSWSGSQDAKKLARDFIQTQPRAALVEFLNEDCSGDFISRSKNVHYGFSSSDNSNCSYLFECSRDNSVVDAESVYDSELIYSAVKGFRLNRCAFTENCTYSNNLYYSSYCKHSQNLILCVGLYRKEYCILNRQLTKEEYYQALPIVIERLKEAGLWGEFFSPSFSDFGFNESEAVYHFPLEEEQATKRGFKWNSYDPESTIPANSIQASTLPDSIMDVDDSILNVAIVSILRTKAFKIQRPELNYYRKKGIPLPRYHPEERYREMLKLRNEPILFTTICAECNRETPTTYPPGSPEILLCQECAVNRSA